MIERDLSTIFLKKRGMEGWKDGRMEGWKVPIETLMAVVGLEGCSPWEPDKRTGGCFDNISFKRSGQSWKFCHAAFCRIFGVLSHQSKATCGFFLRELEPP